METKATSITVMIRHSMPSITPRTFAFRSIFRAPRTAITAMHASAGIHQCMFLTPVCASRKPETVAPNMP